MDNRKALLAINGILAVVGYSDEVDLLKIVVRALADKKINRAEFEQILKALDACVVDDNV